MYQPMETIVHFLQLHTFQSSDLVVVLVDHPQFEPAVIAEHARLVFDTKNLLRGTAFVGEVL